MIKRPKRGETEDDLLNYQQDFFASQQKPSVVVKKLKQAERDVVTMEDEIQDPATVKTTGSSMKFPSDKLHRFKIREEDLDPRQRLDGKDKEHVSEILTNIKEKDIETYFNFKANSYKGGFPNAPTINKNLLTESKLTNGGKKKSLFAQQFSNFNEQKDLGKTSDIKMSATIRGNQFEKYNVKKDIVTDGFLDCQTASASNVGSDETDTPSSYQQSSSHQESCVISKDEIHQENVHRLHSMSEEEILEEQKKLLDALDPKVIDFLKARSKPPPPNGGSSSDVQGTSSKFIVDDQQNMNDDLPSDDPMLEIHRQEDTSNKVTGDEKMEVTIIGDEKDQVINPYQKFGIKKDFVNMDIVENEKLAWMKDLPKIELKEDNVAPRFDFEGMLIDPTSEIAIDTGLHHHGDEPSLPGYTLEELFHLARSNFPQQRVFSLQLIGRIFDMYHQQEFSGKLTADLLTKCLDAGLVFMLRWSLDEQMEQTYSAAVAAIANIVYLKNDQNMVENYLFTEKGHVIPSLCTYYKKTDNEMSQSEQEEERDLTDAELVSLDLIKGLLQIQIIQRLRYIIEICNPSAPAINNCLCILIRMAQHNAEVARNVFKHELLMPAVFKLFTSTKPECKEETKVYALQLVRCLCQASKSIAQEMVKTYKLDEMICTEFSAIESVALYSTGATYIQICHIWKVLLHYGICTSLVRDLYATIMNQLQQYSTSYKNMGDKMLASLINIVNAAITCTTNVDIEWSLIEGLFPVVYHTIKTIKQDMFKEEKVSHPYFISVLLRCCGTYFKYKNTKLSEVNPVTLLDDVAAFWKEIIQPIISSPLMHNLLDEMRKYSDFKSFKTGTDQHFKNPENLTSFGTYCLPGGVAPPSLGNDSPMVIIQALLKLILQLVNINKTLIVKALPIILAPETLAYIKFLLESKNLKRCSILVSTRVEILLLSHLLELFHLVESKHGFVKFGQTALSAIQELTSQLICYLGKDDARIAIRLMKKIVFNSKMFSKQNYMLWMSEYYENNLEDVIKEQLQTTRSNLLHISSMYRKMLFADREKSTPEKSSFLISSLQRKAVPYDWMFYPIVHFYNTSVNVEQAGGIIASASPEVISVIELCLQYILLVEVTRPALVANIPETIRLTRLICLFMTEGLLFNEKCIKNLLISVVANYSAPSFQSYLNLEMDIPGITSFVDFYKSVVGMYISTSFNDYGFANVLLFPLQLQHNVKYRLLIWTEFSEIFRIFPLPLNQVILDIKTFLAAENDDTMMIRLYFQALIGGTAKSTWCPLFYLIAVHHVNHYIFSLPCEVENENSEQGKVDIAKQDQEEKSTMMNTLFSSSNKTLAEDVILYKCFDINCERGIRKFSHLPPSRELLVRSIRENR